MPEHANQPDDGQLEAYLDGLLNGAERAAFAERLRTDPELRRQAELQERIDQAMRQMFEAETPSIERVLAMAAGAEATAMSVTPAASPLQAPAVERSFRRYWIAAASVAAAAAMAWIVATVAWNRPGVDEPYFAVRPLVDVYQDAVASGFEPSYECREADRFAATFRQRQGQPLALLPMPAGAHMLGLSYVGGLSRQTTAMLCRVDGEPVMVFVDRAEADEPMAAAKGADGLRVFREERDGLVFYEVTPLAEPRVTSFLAPGAGDASGTPAPTAA